MKLISKRFGVVIFVLYIFSGISPCAWADSGVCILNFELKDHPFTQVIDNIFGGRPDTRVVDNAIPTDFISCIQDGYQEIVLVAHAVEGPNPNEVRLGYFKQDGTSDAYAVKTFLPHVFEQAEQILVDQKNSGQPVRLKQIRLMSCLPGQVYASYPAFESMVNENSLELDMAPEQVMMSLLEGKQVTTLDRLWLGESALNQEIQSNPEGWTYAYMDLTTFILYRQGNGSTLRGQYRVNVQGLAIGIGQKWSTVFVRNKDFLGMAVGETRSIQTLEFDLSMALWLNIELEILPKANLQLPSEINSWGASLGIASNIELERVY